VLAGVAGVALVVLGATSVFLGFLCGPLVALAILAVEAIVRGRSEECRAGTDLGGEAMIEESMRLGVAAERAEKVSHVLRSIAARRSAAAIDAADQCDAAEAWESQEVSAMLEAAARDVDEVRRQMAVRRDVLGAEGVRREMRAELEAKDGPRARGPASSRRG
jgi:hypothetical protein